MLNLPNKFTISMARFLSNLFANPASERPFAKIRLPESRHMYMTVVLKDVKALQEIF